MTEKKAVTIVVCEDDADIRMLLVELLCREGYRALAAADAAELARLSAARAVDLVVLDWMLPGEDGLSICRRLRAERGPPVLMLTARSDDADRIEGLETGADAYVSKPFSTGVLLAQIRAILRRHAATVSLCGPLRVVDLVVDVGARRVHADTSEVALTAGEFDLLVCFATRPQRVLSREELLATTRGRLPGHVDRTIDVQVSRLRHKLEAAGSEVGTRIKTVRNAGYILAAAVDAA